MKENSNGTDTNVGTIGNSIEEDIELLQDETSSLGLFFKCKGSEKYKIALEHILSDYKRVLKENEKIRNGRNRLFEYATAQQTTPEMLNKILREDYISIQKVKDKQKEKEWALESYDCDEADYKQSQAIGAWQVLQELIEERREK